ncbi:hypothetical protein GCM10027395_27750 [Giesbergeria sinuosa]
MRAALPSISSAKNGILCHWGSWAAMPKLAGSKSQQAKPKDGGDHIGGLDEISLRAAHTTD